MNVLLWAVLGLFTILLATLVVGIVIIKRQAKAGKVLLVGKRPSTGRLVFRWGRAVRGGYTWREPGDFEAYVPLDNAFLWDSNWGRVVFVDLDTYHPIRYLGKDGKLAHTPGGARVTTDGVDGAPQLLPPDEAGKEEPVAMPKVAVLTIAYDGKCVNDEDETVFQNRKGVEVGRIRGLWRRLPGTRLAQMRKDTRIQQMNEMLGGVLAQLMRYVPLLSILTFVAILVLIGVVGYGQAHHGG